MDFKLKYEESENKCDKKRINKGIHGNIKTRAFRVSEHDIKEEFKINRSREHRRQRMNKQQRQIWSIPIKLWSLYKGQTDGSFKARIRDDKKAFDNIKLTL